MAKLRRQPADRPSAWPAWCASLVIHATLLATTLYVLRQPAVRGAVEAASRDVGIVLKEMTDDGPRFEDEDNQPPTEANANQNDALGNAALAALPAESDMPNTDLLIAHLPTLGAGALEGGGIGDARVMTQGGPAAKNIGGVATVRVFGVEGVGSKFVYVFDRSISMEGPPLRAAKQELLASLESLSSVHQFQIIFFNHEPAAWDITAGQQRIAFATDRNKRLAENFVDGISANGGTYRRAALQLALRLRPDVVFFLTDADDPMPGADLADAVRRAQRNATAINTIEFGVGAARTRENFLVKLARDTGGRYAYVNTLRLGK